ncbi:putative oligopeptidase A [Helianthus anomalus]
MKLDGDLVELEKTVEPTWPKLVEPLEKMMDRLIVVWGAVNYLQAIKDTPELQSTVKEIQVCFYWFWFV